MGCDRSYGDSVLAIFFGFRCKPLCQQDFLHEGFPGWQNTKTGEREVQKALRKVIYVKYQVKDQDLFDKAFGYIRQYY